MREAGPSSVGNVAQDAELARALEDYLAELETGSAPDPEALIAAHPDVADRLRTCLGSLQFVEQAGEDLGFPSPLQSEPKGERTLGDFRIVREIGRGGMGVVYEAEQISLRRPVALKVLPFAALLDPRQLQRFKNEVQAAASLRHPNIVQVLTVGCERAMHYYAMEFIEGKTLAEVIAEMRQGATGSLPARAEQARADQQPVAPRGKLPFLSLPEKVATKSPGESPLLDSPRPLAGKGLGVRAAGAESPPGEAQVNLRVADTHPIAHAQASTQKTSGTREFCRQVAKWGLQTAEGLEHAHQLGIVHRDIKPSNLLVAFYPCPFGRGVGGEGSHLWITDFGLAQVQSDVNLTMTGDVLGTLRYMSPEQAQGDRRVLDHRTDVYSLGVTLYETLTLQPPFAGDDRHELIHQIIDGEPQPLHQVNASIPRDLETIVLRAMAAEPEARYATAQALADDLRRFLADEPIRARRPSLAERASKWSRRHRPVVWAAAGGLLVTLVTAVASALLIAGAYEREKSERLTAQRSETRALSAEELAKKQERLAKRQEQLANQQRELAVAQGEEALRQRDISDQNLYVAHLRLAKHDWESGQISRMHDLLDTHIPEPARSDRRGWEWYYLLSLCHSDRFTFRGHEGQVSSVAWSPDGTRLASAGWGPSVKIWDPRTGDVVQTFPGDARYVSSVAWSPDGQHVACGGHDTKVRICEVATGREVFALGGHTGGVCSVAWSPDSRRLASGSGDGTMKIWDTTAGEEIQSIFASKGAYSKGTDSVAWSPDGRRLVSGHNRVVKIWDADTGRETASWPDLLAEAHDVAWSPDGRSVAIGFYGRHVQVRDAATGRTLLKVPLPGGVDAVAWSPDGKYLASGDRSETIRIWDVDAVEELLTLRGHRGWVSSLAWSPDGAMLASAAGDHTVKIWEPHRKQPISIEAKSGGYVAWCPLGDRLTSCGGGSVQIWDLGVAQPIRTLPGGCFAWSPDGKRLAVHRNRQTVIVDDLTGDEALTLETGDAAAIEWSPDGKRLALGTSGKSPIRIWDVSTGMEVLSLRPHHVSSADGQSTPFGFRLSPEGRRVATSGFDGLVNIWDAASGEQVLTLRGHAGNRWVRAQAWSPDGTRLASGGFDQTVKVWDTSTGQEVASLRGHRGAVWTLAWSPDGTRLASAGHDGEVKIWDPSRGEELLSLRETLPPRNITSLAWSRDGVRLAAAGGGRITIWDASRGYAFAHSGAYLADAQISRASADLREGAFDEAIARCSEAIRLDPTLVAAYRIRGNAHAALEQWHEAAGDFGRAVDLENGHRDSYLAALLHLALGDCQAYASQCRDMLARFGDTRDAHTASFTAWTCALAPYALRDRARVVRLAEKAIRDDPMEPMRLATYGAALYRAGRFRDAARILGEAAELAGSENATVLTSPAYPCFFLALADHRLGNAGEATKWLERAARLSEEAFSPDSGMWDSSPLAWNRRLTLDLLREEAESLLKTKAAPRADLPPAKDAPATLAHALVSTAYPLWLEQGDRDEALRRLSKAITLLKELTARFPEEPRYQMDLAVACKARGKAIRGDPERAVADLTEAITIAGKLMASSPNTRASAFQDWNPAHVLARAITWRAVPLMERGKLDEAIADCNVAIRLDPQNDDNYRRRGFAHAWKGEYDLALADFAKLDELGSHNGAEYRRAAALLLSGKQEPYREACADLVREQADSEDASKVYLAARACVLAPAAVNDPDVPVAIAQRAVALKPGVAWQVHTLGMACCRAGQLDEAERTLRESLEVKPDWPARYLNWLGLALVDHQRGDEQKAHEWFTKAADWMREHRAEHLNITDWMEGELLRREVEELLDTRQEDFEHTKREKESGDQG